MLNAIDNAVNKIRLAIPREILEKSFIDNNVGYKAYRSAVNLDTIIKQKVIREIVLVDCNLLGGNEIEVAVQRNWIQIIDNFNMVIRVPKQFTQNRLITEVQSLVFIPYGYGANAYGNMQGVSDVLLAQNKLLNSTREMVQAGTVECEVVGENVIAVQASYVSPSNIGMTVIVEHDEQMSRLKKQGYIRFAELCVLAAKAWIWANKIIEVDKAEIHGGYQLNKFTSIIEDYSSAYEEYHEFLQEKWRAVAAQSDPKKHQKFLQTITKIGLQ